ncbi:O-antigen ligase family protein [Candidatus Arthromitus sp. SFB-rat-Yit]|uniref:O-antigen ligase family protein n=1 Tax=Candidatus Arthromitus sp. SFB-rat-Yit TaxID=1041504 RepID=UPI0002E56492|nr:O-antigen ligase family protein [Candidatus Arthromitus sp. SFB-rat-Yit]
MFKRLESKDLQPAGDRLKLDFDMVKFYITLVYLIFNFSYVSIIGELSHIVSILNYLFYVVFILIFVYSVYKNKFEFTFYNCVFILFLFSTVVSMYLNSYSFGEYINEIKLILLGMFQFFIFFNVINKNKDIKLKILSTVILGVCFISHIFSIIFYIFKVRFVLTKVYGFHFDGSFTGIYDNENILGIICFIGIVFSFIFLNYYKEILFKKIAIINVILSIIMLFLVSARSAVIAFLVFCFVFTAITFKKKWIVITFFVGCCLFSIYLLINNTLLVKLLNGRYEIWEQVLTIIKNNILFGYSKTHSINVLDNSTIRFLSGVKEGGTHNTFLDILLSYGSVALVLFVSFIVVYLIRIYKILRKNIDKFNYIVLYSAVLSFLFIGMFESVLVYTPSLIGIIFWIIMGYVKDES